MSRHFCRDSGPCGAWKIFHLPHLEAWASHQLLRKLHHMCRSLPKPKRTWRSHLIQVDLLEDLGSFSPGTPGWLVGGVHQIWMKEFQWFAVLAVYWNIGLAYWVLRFCTIGTACPYQPKLQPPESVPYYCSVAAFSVIRVGGLIIQSAEAACPSKNWKSSWQRWALTMKLAWRRPKFAERYKDD